MERFPNKPGEILNESVQKRMLYLQDINHSAYPDKQRFLNQFLKDIDKVDSIKDKNGQILYGDRITGFYSKKAILQAKYNDPARYQELTDLIGLYKEGKVPKHCVAIFFPEAHFHPLPKGDMQKLLKGEHYFPELKKLSEKEISNIEFGEVFSVGEKMFVKTEDGYEALKINKQTYEKLFPAVERYSIAQSRAGNCGKIASYNAMIKNPKSRIELYRMFEQTPDGARVKIKREGRWDVDRLDRDREEYIKPFEYVMDFNKNNLDCLYTEYNLQGSLGHKMIEYTFDTKHYGNLDTGGNPRGWMISRFLNKSEDEYWFPFGMLNNKDITLEEFCAKHKRGVYVGPGSAKHANLNLGNVDDHYYSTTDLSTGLWQNPWTGMEEMKLGFDGCAAGSIHDF